nr:uncharacterized protein LOC109153216 [Ipomoea batatas]
MPQVDLETLVSACAGGGTDRKIACETLADGRVESDEKRENDDSVDDYEKRAAPDLLPESFLISKDAEFDWFDRNAFLERKESGKEVREIEGFDNRASQDSEEQLRRFDAEELQQTGEYPSFPAAACGVYGETGKSRSVGGREKSKTGFYSRLVSVFLSNRGKKPAEKIEKETPSRWKSVKERKSRQVPVVSIEPLAEPPGLGGMKRFASGRKSESWGANEINAAVSDAFGTERR